MINIMVRCKDFNFKLIEANSLVELSVIKQYFNPSINIIDIIDNNHNKIESINITDLLPKINFDKNTFKIKIRDKKIAEGEIDDKNIIWLANKFFTKPIQKNYLVNLVAKLDTQLYLPINNNIHINIEQRYIYVTTDITTTDAILIEELINHKYTPSDIKPAYL